MASAKKNASTAATNTSNQAGAAISPLMAGAQNLANSNGYDPASLSAIQNAAIGGVNSAAGDAAGKITRQAAINKNPAGTAGALDTLALNKGIAGGNVAGGIQEANQQFKTQQRQAGLNLLSGIYGTATNANTGDINAQTRADQAPFQDFNSILSGIGDLGKIPGVKV